MTQPSGNSGSRRHEFSEAAEAQLDDAYRWLLSLSLSGEGGYSVAERWLPSLQRVVEQEIALLSGEPAIRRAPAPESSPARERFAIVFRTVGKRSSPWRLVDELRDEDHDKVVDTLRVISIRHAASL